MLRAQAGIVFNTYLRMMMCGPLVQLFQRGLGRGFRTLKPGAGGADHLPILTVRETLHFARMCQLGPMPTKKDFSPVLAAQASKNGARRLQGAGLAGSQ